MNNGLPASLAVGVCFLCASALFSGCGQTDGQGMGIETEDGSLRGEFAIYIADGVDGQSETHYALRSVSGLERRLVFDSEVNLEPGTELKVWGIDSPEGVRVTSFERISPAIERTTSALTSGVPYAPRNFAFVMLNLNGGGIGTITPAAVMGRMITDPTSIRNYYLNDSYGMQDITAQVFGPLNYTFPATCTTQDTNALASSLRAMIPGTFNHYLWYFGTAQGQCLWQGLGSVGTAQNPTRDTWYNVGSLANTCVVLVQEPGHNFGMQHSSSLSCPGGVSFLDDPNTCRTAEYGDLYDPMGSGCRHMNAWQKSYQGWFGGCNGVAVTSSGTFTLLPFENRCAGTQFLKIKAAKSRTFNRPASGGSAPSTETMGFYYVELRTPVDFDGILGNRTALAPEVLVHAGDDVRGRTQRGVHTYLLDMTPTTTSFVDAALKVGTTFTDPAGGVSITTTAVSATQATIDVTIDPAVVVEGTSPTCLDGTTLPSPAPGPESCEPAGNAGGATGTGGTTGAGGATGTGGRAGSTGGTGGRGGTAGNAGVAGNPGGLIGSGGTLGTGSGGANNPADAGGLVAPTGDASGTGVQGASSAIESGCACTMGRNSPSHWGSTTSMIAMILFASARSRRRRR